ncbi:SRPBCC family protein [Aeromicrobium piscarium]|uniref:Clp R domain-containing protein n=1 Tax=Aeromicrobium piscarium TaxID=2590901 RepID=A0A554RI25_9ACTN|nr:Clp protease N-terminal domain-containing protein [Aeromicrobium piscarium]TSD53701.1 hypothetical protein FNM00_18020 [Aeromicrobium piscarium]
MRQLAPHGGADRPALRRAEREASSWGHPEVDVEHLLLALADLPGPARSLLLANGVSYVIASLAFERQLGNGRVAHRSRIEQASAHGSSAGSELSWSPRALEVVRGVQSGSDLDLLVAVLTENSGATVAVLEAAGTSPRVLLGAVARTGGPKIRRGASTAAATRSLSIAHAVRIGVPAALVWSDIDDPVRWPLARPDLSVREHGSGQWEFTVARRGAAVSGMITLLARVAPWGVTFEVTWDGRADAQRHSFVVVEESAELTTLELYVQSDFRSSAPTWVRRRLARTVERASRRRARDELDALARHLERRFAD